MEPKSFKTKTGICEIHSDRIELKRIGARGELAEAAVGIVLVEEVAVGIGVVRLEVEVVVGTAAVLAVGIVRVAAAVVGIVVDWGVERIAAAADDKPVVPEFRARVERDVPEAAEGASCRD